MHPLSISVTISNVRILFLKHFKVVTSLKSQGDEKWQQLMRFSVSLQTAHRYLRDCVGTAPGILDR